jgi:hypothetical protein
MVEYIGCLYSVEIALLANATQYHTARNHQGLDNQLITRAGDVDCLFSLALSISGFCKRLTGSYSHSQP